MIVVFTDEALADLEMIGDYIARDNPDRAITFVNELIDCCADLADKPQRFAVIPRYHHHDIRRRPYKRYIIFYRPNAKTIDILHVLNAAQDYEAILFDAEE